MPRFLPSQRPYTCREMRKNQAEICSGERRVILIGSDFKACQWAMQTEPGSPAWQISAPAFEMY